MNKWIEPAIANVRIRSNVIAGVKVGPGGAHLEVPDRGIVPYRICAGRRKFRVCRPIELCVEPSASQDDLRGKAIAKALAQLTLPCPNQYQERQISQAWRIEARSTKNTANQRAHAAF
jgi:hypothetical protein